MNDWDNRPDRNQEPNWRSREMEPRERDIGDRAFRDRRPGEGRNFGAPRRGREGGGFDDRHDGRPYAGGGEAAQGYGDGGQMARGSSDTRGGGFGGANVGGWGQSGLTSQWGAGGYGPLNNGLEYGQDSAGFGPQGYDEGNFGAPRHDEHHASYRNWRDTQLSNHDRDYSHWRSEQARRYDEDYHGWRNERHSAFSKEFEGWRSGRGGQATPPAPDADMIHGANPTLSKIAEGHEGRTVHHDKPEHDKDKDKGLDHN
jgi:hypothetical protein